MKREYLLSFTNHNHQDYSQCINILYFKQAVVKCVYHFICFDRNFTKVTDWYEISPLSVNTASLEVGGQHHTLHCPEAHIVSLAPAHTGHDHVVTVLTIMKTFNTCSDSLAATKLYLQELPLPTPVHLYRLRSSPWYFKHGSKLWWILKKPI